MSGIFRAIFGYCLLVFMLRVVGRRPGKQMTPFEIVLILFIGGLTLMPLVGDDRSISNVLISIMAIGVTHFLIAWLKQVSPRFGRIAEGTPLIVFENDQWNAETMKKLAIQDDDVMAVARAQGLRTLDQIEYATIERNGEISIIPKKQSTS